MYRSTFLGVVIVTGCLLTIFFQNGTMPRQGLSNKITRWWCRRIANAFGIPVRVFGTPSNKATLFIANHISWFDIIAIGSTTSTHFLSKIEVKNIPIIGWLASRAGTLYMPRGLRTAAKVANTTMADALKQDHHVVLFPEGTTGNGKIKRFHSRLIQCAITAQCTVQPIAIRYPSESENDVHPAALYVGDTTMGQSVANIMSASDLIVEVYFLEPIEATGMSRDELAAYAEKKVRSVIENGRDAK